MARNHFDDKFDFSKYKMKPKPPCFKQFRNLFMIIAVAVIMIISFIRLNAKTHDLYKASTYPSTNFQQKLVFQQENDRKRMGLNDLLQKADENKKIDQRNKYDHNKAPVRPCGDHVELSQHYVERDQWQKITDQEVVQRKDAWVNFLNDQVPLINYNSMNFTGKGIVYTSNADTFQRCITSVKLLRLYGCVLPIEVWYVGNELTADHKSAFNGLRVTLKDLLVEQQKFPDFTKFNIKYKENERNYQIKILVLLLSKFKEFLYLDSDNMPLKDPTYLFSSPQYHYTGAVFWKDFWKYPKDNPMWKISGLTCVEEYEQESGQMVIHKQKAWKGLLMALHFQMEHQFYFSFMLGDKDTFRFGFKLSDTPFHYIKHPVALAGRVRQNRFCGYTMIQPDINGNFLFAHASILKIQKAVKLGNTWETIQYLRPADFIETSSSDKNSRNFIVNYPLTNEYGGGIEKEQSEGGVGEEAEINRCLDFNLKDVTIFLDKNFVDKEGPENVLESYQVVTENFKTFNKAEFLEFEKNYYKFYEESVLPKK